MKQNKANTKNQVPIKKQQASPHISQTGKKLSRGRRQQHQKRNVFDVVKFDKNDYNDNEKLLFEAGYMNIHSFKLKPMKNFCANFNDLKVTLGKECLRQLTIFNKHTGLSVCIEKPSYCLAKNISIESTINVARKPVLRQYFGKEDTRSKNKAYAKRYVYALGSGSATIGTDKQNWRTREMTAEMKRMAQLLQNYVMSLKEYSGMATNLSLNTCVVLYYIRDEKGSITSKEVSSLGWHCDISHIHKGNSFQVKTGQSQVQDTPTIVLTLGCERQIQFGVREHNGKKFLDTAPVASMSLEDGDVFVLHSNDEYVSHRGFPPKPCQFQHCVKGNLKSNEPPYLSIALCFRQCSITKNISRTEHTIIEDDNISAVITKKTREDAAFIKNATPDLSLRKRYENAYKELVYKVKIKYEACWAPYAE